ncbi:MAG: hypothetical protein IKU59_06980 [Bacteroidales bacterium]|nr:hypothetical protein [Bacteroidales bacterium]
MKHLKHYVSLLSMLMVISVFFSSCGGEDDEMCKISVLSGEGGAAYASEREVVPGWEVTLTAISESGYQFVNWTIAGVEVSRVTPYTTIVTEDTQFKANFEKIYVGEEDGDDDEIGSGDDNDNNGGVIIENRHNGHEYVDLGLSVKWATCYVGADTPEESGDYFAWGETEPKDIYNWATYKWCNGTSDVMTKYCTSSTYGEVDNNRSLEFSDDAARVNWGGSWRIPTELEQQELTNNCSWIWTTQKGVSGYKVISNINHNSIFLAATGMRDGSSLGWTDSYGTYWLNSLHNNNTYANYFSFEQGKKGIYCLNRYYGRVVRAVCP